MATGGTPFDDSAEELHNWTVTNGSLDDRLNNMVMASQNLMETLDMSGSFIFPSCYTGGGTQCFMFLCSQLKHNCVIQTVKYMLL